MLRRCVLVLAALLTAQGASAGDILVFAAASTKTAMDEIAVEWKRQSGHEATISYAGSSALARQIESGAPADIFISANEDWMDALERKALIAAGTRTDLLGNTLVLIAHGRDAPTVDITGNPDISRLIGNGRLAMAMVDSVPAGIYGKAALESLGLWNAVAPLVAQTDNVRAALALVASGEAPFGIVYATDAAASDNVSVVARFPAGSHAPIVYPAAAIAGRDNTLAREFLSFLRTDAAATAFERQGFDVLR
ncbi:MAG: molybdate ABC transporter substrate-binding protein [Rhodobiaceae bacterium]|nr:molybdate ABC transporter substrate-binding protein [Rhodobiaceae bacterium]